ncbi:ABC transporter substrate-binding protein [Vibrio sp. JPW-9-11-11]|nr:ABC transporter substrate-binding protein [Vibrio sp. JPW-9-11-11]NVD08998.1 ABC transporter substrate-binding protein [Vibrio sp. JPW-9-11-11]
MTHTFEGLCGVGKGKAYLIRRVIGWMLLSVFASHVQAEQEQLVILTTFSSEPISELIEDYKHRYPDVDIKLMHRRTQSVIQLLNKSYIKDVNVDVVLSSSPFMMQELNKRNQLAQVNFANDLPTWLVPFVLPDKQQVTSVGYSGAGLVWNNDYLRANELKKPQRFSDLTDFEYFGHLTMSTPSRSGTTQMMVESLLARYGWGKGWEILLNVGANLGTISSRSFGVSDYVAKGQFAIGPTIDSYALVLNNQFDYIEFRYDYDFTLMPTYIGVLKQSDKSLATRQFVELLLSQQIQSTMLTSSFSKHAIADPALYSEAIPRLDIEKLMVREKLVNLIFDEMITKRLPELQDAWFSLMTLKKNTTSSGALKQELQQLRAQLFRIPASEQQLEDYADKIAREMNDEGTDDGFERAMLAEFGYHFGAQFDDSLTQVTQRISQLQQEHGQ